MKTIAYLLTKDNQILVSRITKKELQNGKFIRDDKNYYIQKDSIFLKPSFLGVKRYIFYKENSPNPIKFEETPIDIQKIIKSHIISEFLTPIDKNRLMFIIFLILGMLLGLLIGIVIEPHLFPSTSTPIINGTRGVI